MLLPEIKTGDDYRSLYRKFKTWLPAMQVICDRHGYDKSQLEFAPPGTHVVFRLNPDLYIKLFAPLWPDDYTAEVTVLRKLSGYKDLKIPHLVNEGKIEGWPYLIIKRIKGVPLVDVWNFMSFRDKEFVAAWCGEFLAKLHRIDIDGLEAINVKWSDFVDAQIKACINELKKVNIESHWISSVEDFFGGLPCLYEPDFQPILLDADITDEHVMVNKYNGKWEVTGIIDFGDAMLGYPLYDFAAPGCCITNSSPLLRRAMLMAYGYNPDELNEAFEDRLMAYTLIHKFINIPEILEILDPRKPGDFCQLKRELWSL
ncbi:phosphotransferase [Candidatus Poribacteria bacterium]|nr:phosphotransferase [Candidatus Poribacteria bacterium]